ncbi:MAG: hypothetical protein UH654_04515 [Lachnospiraceae bacterium]|nr:hypothetical protein [Lachnospiraceae bacterium]
MVEQSIFINNNELKNWINNTYDLEIDKVEKTELGSASSFGYKEYLKNKSDKNLDFAFWRTKMCRWLYNNMDEFEAYLDKYYKN